MRLFSKSNINDRRKVVHKSKEENFENVTLLEFYFCFVIFKPYEVIDELFCKVVIDNNYYCLANCSDNYGPSNIFLKMPCVNCKVIPGYKKSS